MTRRLMPCPCQQAKVSANQGATFHLASLLNIANNVDQTGARNIYGDIYDLYMDSLIAQKVRSLAF